MAPLKGQLQVRQAGRRVCLAGSFQVGDSGQRSDRMVNWIDMPQRM